MTIFDENLLKKLSTLILKTTGLCYPKERWQELENALLMLTEKLHIGNSQFLMQEVLSQHENYLELLINRLTVKETYFYRDLEVFKALETTILPDIIAKNLSHKTLRFWSAGCCTGEEAYSLAIALHRVLPSLMDWNIRILGTDINADFLRAAQIGKYREWSFRGDLPWVRHIFFNQESNGISQIKPEVQSLVSFRKLNLVDLRSLDDVDTYTKFDLILCRNVFIYLDSNVIKRTIGKLFQMLTYDGYFLTGLSEATNVWFQSYIEHKVNDVIFYSKGNKFSYVAPDLVSVPELAFEPEEVSGLEVSQPDIQAQPLPQKVEDYARAVQFYDEKNYQEAERVACALLIEKNHQEARLLLALICVNQGNFQRARDYCRQVISEDKLRAEAYFLLALTYIEQGELREAQNALERAMFIDPNFVMPHMLLGQLFSKQGRRREAHRIIKHALSLLNYQNKETLVPYSDGRSVRDLEVMLESQLEKSKAEVSR